MKFSVSKTLMLLLALVVFAPAMSAFAQQREIKWLTMEEAVEKSKKKKKKIFVDVYTDWCHWCKVMDKKTFTDAGVIDYINQNYYAVKLNAEGTQNIIYDGKVYKPAYRGKVHELAYELLGPRMGFPTVVFINEKFEVIKSVPGYKKPDDMVPLLGYFAEEAFKKQTFEQYVKAK